MKTGTIKTPEQLRKAEGEGIYGYHNADPDRLRCTGHYHFDRFDSTPPYAGEVSHNEVHRAARQLSRRRHDYPPAAGLCRAGGIRPRLLLRAAGKEACRLMAARTPAEKVVLIRERQAGTEKRRETET
jgi:hypothetical protein